MRILIVSNLFPPEVIGGYEMIAHEMAERLARAGHEILVATSPLVNHSQELPDLPFRIARSLRYDSLSPSGIARDEGGKFGPSLNMANIFALRGAIAEFAPDQVFLFNLEGLGAPGIVCFLHQAGFCPAIYLGDSVFHNACRCAREYDLFRTLFHFGPALQALRPIAVSEQLLEEIGKSLGAPLPASLLVPGWVPSDLPSLAPCPATSPLRLVFSSRIASHKGTEILLDAARHLLACGDRDFLIDVYGAGGVPLFLQRVHADGLAGHIRYRGMVPREEMLARLSQYEALLFPSWTREPLGLVPFEAAAQGCVPIITAQIGAAEWLTSADCLKIERTPLGLAGAVQSLMAMPPDERLAWRRRIGAHVRHDFGADAWMARIERVLADLPPRRKTIDIQKIQNAMLAIARVGEL